MGCGVTFVDKFLTRNFYKLGIFVGSNPGYFLIIPVLLSLLCITGFQRMHYEIDPEYLFSPINGEGKHERAVVEEFFKPNYTSRFNVGRITRPGRFGRIIAIPRDKGDMLRVEIWKELRELDELIQNTTAHYEDETFTYRDVCAKWINECFQNDILNLDYVMEEIEKKELNLTFPIMFNPVTWDAHTFPVYFGGTTVSDDGIIISVPSVQLVYFVRADNKKQDARGAAWEEAFLSAIDKAEKDHVFKYISTARFASRTLDIELERNTRTVVPYFGSTFALMVGFSVITCMMFDWVRSKPILGLMGNISAAMATVAAFGFAIYLGFDFIGINLAAPFLMVGIGIDDTFVMLAAWRRTSITKSVPERMGLTLSEAAVSITITSVTDTVSFFIGVFSPFRSVQLFCIYSGIATIFTFMWHITFFSGCLALSGYCERKNLHSIFCIPVQPKSLSENRHWLYRVFCAGGINHDDPNNPKDNEEHMLMLFFKNQVAGFLNKWQVKILVSLILVMLLSRRNYPAFKLQSWLFVTFLPFFADERQLEENGFKVSDEAFVKIIWIDIFSRVLNHTQVLLAFVGYWVGACYGLTTLQEGLQRRKLSRADSYSVEFYDREDYYFREFPYRIQVIVSGELNYSDPNTQEEIEKLTQTFENSSYVSNSLYTESWVRSFTSYIRRNGDYLNVSIDTEEDFIKNLKSLWLFKPNPFSLDVKFNEDETRILASRFMIQAVNITDGNHEKEMVQELRRIAHSSPLNVTVFHPYFVFFDQFELVRPTSIQCMVLGAIIMMIISFIFIPDMICGVWVAFSIISIELGVAGYMALWDVRLDSISMINLIMCIGFSVDFTAHICYTYMSSSEKSSKDRVKDSLYSLGLPIVQGSFSTILSVFALILADSYIFLVFFKMVFLVVFFGAMHGLLLLPVLLSLFGPGSCTRKKKEKMSNLEKSLPYPYCIPHPSLISQNWESQKKMEWEVPEKQQYNNFASNKSSVPYLPNLPSHMMISTYERNSPVLEKDLGLGTSGEESSETASGSGQFEITKQDEKQKRLYEEGWKKTSLDKNWDLWKTSDKEGYSNGAYLSDDNRHSPKARVYKISPPDSKHRAPKSENVRKRSSTPTGLNISEKLESTRQYLEEKRRGDNKKPLREFSKHEIKKFSYPPKSDNIWYRPSSSRYPIRYSVDDSQLYDSRRGRQVFRRFSQHESRAKPRSRSQHSYDDF